eukprot:TRINITY_DN9089_c0_g1_i1.p1 TRINITY_DN9089_c0_g1~~TRINITY_DN9089_c0_g1_i1.p1  ORF type:complete len:1027 (-),score=110.19 TRINITY_DN9089_c0_g1_i1:35-3115(-)
MLVTLAAASMVISRSFWFRRHLCIPTFIAAVLRLSAVHGATSEVMERFALVPRPMQLLPLGLSSGSQFDSGTRKNSRSLMFSFSPGPYSPTDPRVKATLSAFESVLGIALDLGDAKGVNSDAIVSVSIESTMKEARNACISAASLGRNSALAANVPSSLSDEQSLEWHMALSLGGHLRVCARDPVGAFRFAQTLRQMLLSTSIQPHENGVASDEGDANSLGRTNVGRLPNFILQDWPKYTWRGLQLDAVRHFMPIPFLKRYLKAMAFVKANVFHWHVSDDQAWRIYSPSHPKLVLASAKTSPEYYTVEEVREVVDYATSLFIHVMPVFEMPGHVLAALAAYPDIACTPDKHFEVPVSREGIYKDAMCVGKATAAHFAGDILAEAAALFPFRYIHVGGDEVEPDFWSESAHVRAFAGMAGLENLDHDIMEAWLCFVGNTLKSLNKTPVMWDDHFVQRSRSVTRKCPGAEKDWVIQAWKLEGDVGDLVSVSPHFPFRTIASPMTRVYLDYPLPSIDFNVTVQWQPGHGQVLGGAAQMWTEDSPPNAVSAKVYPRYFGIADRLWGYGRPTLPRTLDMEVYAAGKRHCAKDAPLAKETGFNCGKFELVVGGLSPIWADAIVDTSLVQFSKDFNARRALDGEPDSYFWCISPRYHDYFLVRWDPQKYPTGRWLKSVAISTGCADRPHDHLKSGMLFAAQWMLAKTRTKFSLVWIMLARFVNGRAVMDSDLLDYGPIAGLYIVVTEPQTEWVAITEIVVELDEEREVVLKSDCNSPSAYFWDSFHPTRRSHTDYHKPAKKPSYPSLARSRPSPPSVNTSRGAIDTAASNHQVVDAKDALVKDSFLPVAGSDDGVQVATSARSLPAQARGDDMRAAATQTTHALADDQKTVMDDLVATADPRNVSVAVSAESDRAAAKSAFAEDSFLPVAGSDDGVQVATSARSFPAQTRRDDMGAAGIQTTHALADDQKTVMDDPVATADPRNVSVAVSLESESAVASAVAEVMTSRDYGGSANRSGDSGGNTVKLEAEVRI